MKRLFTMLLKQIMSGKLTFNKWIIKNKKN